MKGEVESNKASNLTENLGNSPVEFKLLGQETHDIYTVSDGQVLNTSSHNHAHTVELIDLLEFHKAVFI